MPIVAYAYDDLGRRTSLTRGNAKVVTTYGYQTGSPYLASLAHDLYGTNNDVTTTFT